VRVRFGVLGSIEVTADDGRVLGLRGERQRALLAVLLCERSGVLSADQLSAALWSCDRSPKAKRSIPVYVHRLRSVLGDERLLNRPAR
jgi:DNA-binding SARP family transcriptional activator